MRNNNVCINCGCSDIVSDRSLGGRMVCSRCGSSAFRKKSFYPSKYKKIGFLFIGIFVLLLIIIF